MQDLSEAAETLRRRFLDEVSRLRPGLHRYCTRMMGSPLDGEDVVQETLIKGFYSLHTLRDHARLRSWLFRIAHHCCLDELRKRHGLSEWIGESEEERMQPVERLDLGRAMETMVSALPPKERAAVLLKDVLDHTLAEVAEIIDSTPNGVKAALHRGRRKLSRGPVESPSRTMSVAELELVRLYLERFNAQDWPALQSLVRADARLELVGETDRPLGAAGYFDNYTRLPWRWRLALCDVDGYPRIVHFKWADDAWRPFSFVQLSILDGKVAVVRDYVHVEYLAACCERIRPLEGGY